MIVEGRWPNYRLFEYERMLAEEELRVLGATEIQSSTTSIRFQHRRPSALLDRLTYMECLDFGGRLRPCAQRQAELSHLQSRGGKDRQATRFGVHGFHEYKGKFNPQLARALINVVDAKARVLADPFAGSGTALVEALRLSMQAFGRDRSPMAVFLSTAKLRALTSSNPSAVASELAVLAESVGVNLKRGQDSGGGATVPQWCPSTTSYLSKWFTRPAFDALCQAIAAHPPAESSVAAHLSLLALSSILRSVSLQVPEDLRVRRRPPGFVAPSLRDAYSEAVDRLVLALGELEERTETPTFSSSRGNANDADLFASARGRRLIVTSPPYATALPYIDTDRLSLLLLGLATPRQVRCLEASLTGSREWATTEARAWQSAMERNSNGLPEVATDLLAQIESSNRAHGAGFRRAAVPALLYRYFVSMRDDFAAWQRQLRKGERAVVVIGRNRTGPAGRQITIDTPTLLAACAEQAGLSLAAYLPLQTWPRYGLHAANAVDTEVAVVLESTKGR